MRVNKQTIMYALLDILKENAPVRGENIPTGRKMPKDYGRGARGSSPYPGNLKNSLRIAASTDGAAIDIGGAPAPYGVYTEKTSFRKGWMAKSVKQFLQRLQSWGGRIQ